MSPGVPTRVITACCGLAGFSTAILAGLAADNAADSVLIRALISMLCCNVIGWIVGMIAERTIREAIEQSRRAVNTLSTSEAGSMAPEEVLSRNL